MSKAPVPQFPSDEYWKDSPCPAFDAVDYIQRWLGLALWPVASAEVAKQDCAFCFQRECEGFGVTSAFAQASWWDLYHGQGSWERDYAEAYERHGQKTYEDGVAAGKEILASKPGAVGVYSGPARLRSEFIRGVREILGDRVEESEEGLLIRHAKLGDLSGSIH